MPAEIMTRVIRDALLSRNERKIRMLAQNWGIPLPSAPTLFWAHVNRCILQIDDAPEKDKESARWWLKKHGLEV